MTRLGEIDKEFWYSMETIFSGFDGAIIIDETGTILLFTEYYARELGVRAEDVLGKNIQEVFPQTRMIEVMHTGKPIIADRWELKGKGHIVSRVPIIHHNKVIGAVGFNVFPYDKMQYFVAKFSSLNAELSYYKETLQKLSAARYSMQSIIGQSVPILEAKSKAEQIASSSAPVFIYGETGTGKELFAHAIHQESPRRNGPMIRVNCAGIPESLMEAEFFGYEEGAFTGAKKGGKPGKFEIAKLGSLFLDEIGELPYTLQAKLLRVLQEKEFERVGGTEVIKADVRIISASNVDLRKLMKNNLFRGDLFYRLNVFMIKIPPLRERPEDIPILVDHFINDQNAETGTHVEGIAREAMNVLVNYHWPGNVRELEIVIARACLDTKVGVIGIENLLRFGGRKVADITTHGHALLTLREAREAAEKAAILNAMEKTGGNKKKAADFLGIHRTSLYYKLNEYGLLNSTESKPTH